MKAYHLSSVLGAMAFAASVTTASAADVSTRLRADVSENGVLTVETAYLTNYVLRGVNPDTGEEGSIRFLRRNKKALTLPAEIEWDGLVPSVDIGLPEFNTEKTNIDLSVYSFPGGISFENSDLVFRGANLLDLATDFPESREQQIDAVILLLLNSLSLAEIAGEIAGGSDEVFGTAISEKLAPLAEFIVDSKTSLQQIGDVVALVELLLDQTTALLNAAGLSPADYADIAPELQPTLENLRAFTSALDDINVVVSVPPEVRASRTGTIRAQYAKLIDGADDLSNEEVLEAAINEFAERYGAASSDNERTELLFRYVINPAGDVFEILEREQDLELKRLKETGASDETIREQESRVALTRRAFAVTKVARLLFSDVNVVQLAQDDPGQIVEAIFAIGYTVRQELLTIDNAEIITKRALQKAFGLDGRGSVLRTVRDGAQYMKALQLGADIGNKAIPFLWDLVLGPNYLRTSIVDGAVNPYGRPQTLITVERQESGGSKSTFSYGLEVDRFDHTVFADAGDSIDISAFLSRPLLFAEDRAPWRVNQSQIPVTLYSAGIVTPDRFTEKTLCVRRILGNTDFSIQTVDQPDFSANASDCGEGTLRGGSAFDTVPGRRIVYNEPLDLPSTFRISDPFDASSPLETQRYVVKGRESETFSVVYRNFGVPSVTHKFNIKPASSVGEIVVDTSDVEAGSLIISAQATNVPSDEEFTQIVWEWGDGSSTTVSGLDPVSHTYERQGEYTLRATILFANGERLVATQSVSVRTGPPVQPPGTPLAVPGDGNVRLNWNGVEGATSYSVYSATEDFGSPPDYQNFALLENGNVEAGISEISHTVFNLVNDVRYYFVVVAELSDGTEQIVVVVSAVPVPTVPNDMAVEWISKPDQGQTADGSMQPTMKISGDGRFVAFESFATNLLSDDNSRGWLIYDRASDRLERIIADGRLVEPGRGRQVEVHALDRSASQILFFSFSDKLRSDDNDPCLFVLNRVSDDIEKIELPCFDLRFPDDVVMDGAGNLVAYTYEYDLNGVADGGGRRQLFTYDRSTKSLSQITGLRDTDFEFGVAGSVSISDNGRYVAFGWIATEEDQTVIGRGEGQIYLHDTVLETTERVSVASNGDEPDNEALSPDVSDEGDVVFRSAASNLVDGTQGRSNVYFFDRSESEIRSVTFQENGVETVAFATDPKITPDGRFILTRSGRINTETKELSQYAVNEFGEPADINGGNPDGVISDDGQAVAFDILTDRIFLEAGNQSHIYLRNFNVDTNP